MQGTYSASPARTSFDCTSPPPFTVQRGRGVSGRATAQLNSRV